MKLYEKAQTREVFVELVNQTIGENIYKYITVLLMMASDVMTQNVKWIFSTEF